MEDAPGRFVYRDEVVSPLVSACESGGVRLLPERSFYAAASDVPFRHYQVALPSASRPAVSVKDLKTQRITLDFCKEDRLRAEGVEVSNPRLKDGVWITDIRVPLFLLTGNGVTLRESWELEVRFSGNAEGRKPGKRILGSVLNPKAASRFGVRNTPSLRRASISELSGVNFLARFKVGDNQVSTQKEDGLYAVPFNAIRNAMATLGLASNLDGIPVTRLRLYGASPDTLSDVIQNPGDIQPNHLFEIPVEIRDHSGRSSTPNGIFDDGDTLLFVGYGASFWKRADLEDPALATGEMDYYYSVSPYSYEQFFQLGWSSTGTGKRLANLPRMNGAPANLHWLRYVRAEKEIYLRDTYFGKEGAVWEEASGKEWFWVWHARKDSSYLSPDFLRTAETSALPGLTPGGKQYLSVSFFPHRSVWASSIDNETVQIANVEFSAEPYAERMSAIRFQAEVNGKALDGSSRLLPGGNFQMNEPGLKTSDNRFAIHLLPNTRQYDRFDGYSFAYEWTPQWTGTAEWLLPSKASGVIRIPTGTDASLRLMKFKDFEPAGLLPITDGAAADSIDNRHDYRYLLYRENTRLTVSKIEAIPMKPAGITADIARIPAETEYLIIAPEAFAVPALTLKEFRTGKDAPVSLKTEIVFAEDIYKYYTGGSLNPVAIRNYLAYARSIAPDLRYVLLAGNGHYDYRNIRSENQTNIIPPFEKEDAVIEDFFAVLDSGESVRYGSYDIDLAVGRLPITQVAHFNNYNEKVFSYEKKGRMNNEKWRNTILLAADDAFNGTIDYARHTRQQENIAALLDKNATQQGFRFDFEKIYLLDYTADAAGQKPEAALDLVNKINQGAIFSIYFGHGSITDWAAEGLLKPPHVSSLNNIDRLTILGSFSCTVARFDKIDQASLSETFIQASGRGAIASIGAARETFGSYNEVFASTFIQSAFFPGNLLLGDAFRQAKGNGKTTYTPQRYNNERYVLLGEPVISMPRKEFSVQLDQQVDTIQALDKMVLSGSVPGAASGKLHLSILEGRYEKELSLKPAYEDQTEKVIYDGNSIYSETVPVKSGKFNTEFITPRKIAFGDTAAEIRLWFSQDGASGIGKEYFSGIRISGTSSYADSINDSEPPDIQIQSCLSPASGTSFAENAHVKLEAPACLQIVIEDSTAIDFREEADEGISFEVMGHTAPFHPWPYLEQTSKRAVIRMTFAESRYPAGVYRFKVRAEDILGNAATKIIQVEITETLQSGLADVFNAPNPMKKKGTTFYFKDLSVNRTATVSILIYNQNGRLVQVLQNARSGMTTWDGTDFYGRKLANGLYHYVVKSVVPAGGNSKQKVFTKKQKLLISR
jgi:hypothetical protein